MRVFVCTRAVLSICGCMYSYLPVHVHIHIYIYIYRLVITRFFHKQRFFSFQPQCCLTSSWIELQLLLRCCLIYIRIITVRHFLYLLYLRPCVDLCLFMSYLCDPIFIFIFIFIMIHRIISWIRTHLFFFFLFSRIYPFIFG